MKTVAILCRVSTTKQEEHGNLEQQKSAGIEFANRLNLPYKIYSDAESGTISDRKDYQLLLRDIEQNKISVVWMVEQSRQARNLEIAGAFKNLIIKYKVELFVNGTRYDFSSSTTHILYALGAGMAEAEKVEMLRRTSVGLKKRKRNGGLYFKECYGYRQFMRDGKLTIEIDPKQAEIIFNVYAMFNSGAGLWDITKHFGWDETKTRRILKQRMYTGYYIYEDVKVKSYMYPVIIDEETFEKAQVKRAKIKRSYQKLRLTKHQLSGVMHCYHCQVRYAWHAYYGRDSFRKRNDKYYRRYVAKHRKSCNREQKKLSLDEGLTNLLFDVLFVQYIIDKKTQTVYKQKVSEEYNKDDEFIHAKIAQFEKEKAAVKKKKQKLIALILDDNDVAHAIRDLSEQEKRIDISIMEEIKKAELSGEELAKILDALEKADIEAYEHADAMGRRNLLNANIKSAYINNDSLTIEWITGQKDLVHITEIDFIQRIIISMPKLMSEENIPPESQLALKTLLQDSFQRSEYQNVILEMVEKLSKVDMKKIKKKVEEVNLDSLTAEELFKLRSILDKEQLKLFAKLIGYKK